MDGVDLGEEPGAAGVDLGDERRLVEAEFAALDELEVLDCVGDEEGGAVEVELFEDAVEELAGGSDEGEGLEVFLVAGLFADEEEGGFGLAASGDGVRGVFVEVAAAAGGEGGGGARRGCGRRG